MNLEKRSSSPHPANAIAICRKVNVNNTNSNVPKHSAQQNRHSGQSDTLFRIIHISRLGLEPDQVTSDECQSEEFNWPHIQQKEKKLGTPTTFELDVLDLILHHWSAMIVKQDAMRASSTRVKT
jgi:hypothetical protein